MVGRFITRILELIGRGGMGVVAGLPFLGGTDGGVLVAWTDGSFSLFAVLIGGSSRAGGEILGYGSKRGELDSWTSELGGSLSNLRPWAESGDTPWSE